jgi:hypothetical protein
LLTRLALAVLPLAACSEEEGRPAPVPGPERTALIAVKQTLAAGPMRVAATLRSGRVRYRLAGRLDPAGGYRLCAAMVEAPTEYLRGRSLWLDGRARAGTYGTLTAPGRRCARRLTWFDDHPPTLQLYRGDHLPWPRGGRTGAEDFLHAALVAFTRLGDTSVSAVTRRPCGRSECFYVQAAFDSLDREPTRRDEDGWTLRPLLRSLARRPVALRVDSEGFLDRLSLTAPGPLSRGPKTVHVDLGLSAFGDERRVPLVGTRRIAIE